MTNRIKDSGVDGLALQVTKEARTSGLVREDGDDVLRAPVQVYSFDGLLLVVDHDLPDHQVAELVASATRNTESIHRALEATITRAGNGWQVQLPPAEDAGFEVGEQAPVVVGPGILLIHKKQTTRLANDLLSIRKEQTSV